MKVVKNNPKTYRRREAAAPKSHKVISDTQKKKAFAEFIDGRVSNELYIDLRPNPTLSKRSDFPFKN
jgi:hypothetical protein